MSTPDPRTIECSVSARKGLHRSARAAQGYERNVPRCGNCQKMQRAMNSNGNTPRCRIGHFAVTIYDVCNEWTGHTGDKLE